MAAEHMTQIIAGELLNEIERIAPETISNGFLEEVRPKLAGEPNWTFHWAKFEKGDEKFSADLAELRTRKPMVDWSGVMRTLRR